MGVWGVSALFPHAWFDAEITLRQHRLDFPWPRWLLTTLWASASKTDPQGISMCSLWDKRVQSFCEFSYMIVLFTDKEMLFEMVI